MKVRHLGIEAAREAAKKKVNDIKFEPKGSTDLSEPKFGKEDPKNEEHSGGNTWAGGVSNIFLQCDPNVQIAVLHLQTGGRDTAGLGGRGGYMRLFKGHDIKQVCLT